MRLGSSLRANTVMATEQQMSDEWNPGWIASSHATTPPTGIVPSAVPDGQASGITAPATIVGTRINASMCWATAAMLARSNSFSASISIENWQAVGSHQCFDRLQGLQRDKDRIVIRAAGAHGVGGLQGILEPAPGSKAPGDQGVAVNGLRYAHGFASTNSFFSAFRSFNEGPPVGDPSCHALSAGFRRTSLLSSASKPCPSPA